MKILVGLAGSAVLFGMVSLAHSSVLVYSNDFEGLSVNWTEWTNVKTAYDDDVSNFLGYYGNESPTLTLTGLAAHTEIEIHFDLILWDTWDGNSASYGPDYQGLSSDGATVYEYTFSNVGSNPETNPDTTPQLAVNFGGYRSDFIDTYYEDYYDGFTIAHTGNEIALSFYGAGLQSITDESWAIDNVRIYSNAGAPIPEPATMFLFATGLCALVGIRKKKK